MKKTSLLVAALATALSSNAAEVGNAEETAAKLGDIYASVVGVYNIPNVHDKGEWGAGVEVGAVLSKYVSLGLLNVSYAGENTWRGAGYLIDETAVQVHSTLFTSANKSLSFGITASGVRDWNSDDWGFGVGPRFVFGNTDGSGLSLSISSQIRAFMDGDKSLFNTASLNYGF